MRRSATLRAIDSCKVHSHPTRTILSPSPTPPYSCVSRSPYLGRAVLLILGVALTVGAVTYQRFRPEVITLGPATTLYFREPTLTTCVHEAIHRRQMRDKSVVGRLVSALRYPFDYRYRLDEEAEAKAGELCLQIHRFSSELPAYTTARSRSQAAEYRAWAWERIGVRVPGPGRERAQGWRALLRDPARGDAGPDSRDASVG